MYATARSTDALDSLERLPNVHAIPLDTGTKYDDAATSDARLRITSFFRTHLADPPAATSG